MFVGVGHSATLAILTGSILTLLCEMINTEILDAGFFELALLVSEVQVVFADDLKVVSKG